MQPDPELTVHFSVPPVEAILKDLVKLRERLGIAYERMRDAPNLQRTRVVTNELRLRHRDESDRPFVAYDVLECAARHRSLLSPDYSKVLVITLNFDQVPEEQGLRRQRAAKELARVASKETAEESGTYKNIERRAYMSMAALMARLLDSPCHERTADVEGLAKATAQIAALEDAIRQHGDVLDGFRQALGLLRTARSELQLLDACSDLLDLAPLARDFAARAWGLNDDLQIVAELMKGATNTYYESWLTLARFERGRWKMPDGNREAFSKDELILYWTIFERGDLILERAILEETIDSINSEREARGEEGPGLSYYPELNGPQSWEGVTEVDAAYLLLARIWWTLEVSNDWESVDPGAAAKAVQAIPVGPLVPVG